MKDLVFNSLVQFWDTFSEVMLVSNLEYYWEEKDLTNHNLLTTLYAYTLSWYTQTWLSCISLATQKFQCCFAFLFISKLKSGDIITTGQYMNSRTFSNLQYRTLLKIFFIVFTMTWETQTVNKSFLYLSVSLVLFWCPEKPPTFISHLKHVTRWLLQNKYNFQSIEVLVDNVDGDSAHLHKFLGEPPFHFCVNILSQLQNA